MGEAVRHFEANGHEVRVLSADVPGVVTQTDPNIARPRWFGSKPYASIIHSSGKSVAEQNDAGKAAAVAPVRSIQAAIRAAVQPRSPLVNLASSFLFPDITMGWMGPATRTGESLLRRWDCSVILASGPPFSSFVVADRLSRKFGVDWVADYRDLWTSGTYYWLPPLRKRIDHEWERRLLARSRFATTVSGPLATDLHTDFGVRSEVIMNGFDPVLTKPLKDRKPLSEARVNLLYVGGNLYQGRRSPLPLFHAAKQLDLKPQDLQIHFLGTDPTQIDNMATIADVTDLVRVHPKVSHAESLDMQSRSDALLLLMWDDPAEAGIYSGKLFEYIAVARPTLLVGYEGGVAGKLIRERQVGWTASTSEGCKHVLQRLLTDKASAELLPDLPAGRRAGLEREHQIDALEMLLLGQ